MATKWWNRCFTIILQQKKRVQNTDKAKIERNYSLIERILLFKRRYYPKQSTNIMHFLLKFQWHLSQTWEKQS